jgi:4-hydroxy-4-methyl-2-oxoglutarate aldolase
MLNTDPARLADVDTATLHEAFGRRGALPSAIKPVDPCSEVYGPAFTVDCPPADNLWIHRAVYAADRGDVLVVDVRGHVEAGYWGEILSQAAIERGLAGLVIAGGVRDRDRLIALGFPVFAATVCIRGTGKDPAGDGVLGGPVTVGDVVVARGDLVRGDADGVVVMPAGDVPAVLAAAAERIEKERDALERLRAGESTLDIYGLNEEA